MVKFRFLDFMDFPNYMIGSNGRYWRYKNGEWVECKCYEVIGGYWVASLREKGRLVRIYLHRLVLLAFVGPCPEGMECSHEDGNPSNNRLSNLKWDTPSSNNLKKSYHGTAKVGGKNALTKFTLEDVYRVRELYATGEYTFAEIARRTGMSWWNARSIALRETWTHV